MNLRIEKLTEMTLDGKMCPCARDAVFDRSDIFLSEHKMKAKRIKEYILAQEPVLTEYQCFTGAFAFNGSVTGDAMNRQGHAKTQEIMRDFYLKPIDNLVTLEWQHATADFSRVINLGIGGLLKDIEKSKAKHARDDEKVEFLEALETVADALLRWAEKCSERAYELAEKTENTRYKENLLRLSRTLKIVPENPASNFYEAVLFIYLVFSFDPDSLGTLDRTLHKFYFRDIENGTLTRKEATEYLQELFLMLQAKTPKGSCNFTRGGESHFCVGGYTEDGEDFFNEFSMLMLEAVTDLPTYIPQVSLRFTKKLSRKHFCKVLSMLLQDKNNRIAVVNDDAKIHAFMHIAKMPFETACKYSSVGCNEVAFPGGVVGGTTLGNVLHSLESTMFERKDEVKKAETFEDFLKIYSKELEKDIDIMLHYDDEFNRIRSLDTNYVTSLIFADCIENAVSFTKGKSKIAITNPGLIGIVNVFDSLAVIKQFVYDEKAFTMEELISALENNWRGYEDMHTLIEKKAKFFGNDDETSNSVAEIFCDMLYEYTKDKKSVFGYPLIFGNLEGYNAHHAWFGSGMRATPDGRRKGEMLKFGLSQTGEHDREGLSALLNSIAKCDKHGIVTGTASVTNITLDKKMVEGEENFEKTAALLEAYLINGGTHFQLNYVKTEELKEAKVMPEKHKNLRVRVSGFSDYFVNLQDGLQDDIIERTVQNK